MRTPRDARATKPYSTSCTTDDSSVISTTPRSRISCSSKNDASSRAATGEMVTARARLDSVGMVEIGSGTRVFETAAVRGLWRRLSSPDDVLTLMDSSAEGVVACVVDAGATFLAPIFDELTAVVCLAGTPLSHIGIVSREYQVPCLMAATLSRDVAEGTAVEVDCSAEPGVVRTLS